MGMANFLTENINLSMDILFRMYAHSYSTSYNIFYELIHTILNFFVVFRFLNITLYIVKKLLLRLLCIRIEK